MEDAFTTSPYDSFNDSYNSSSTQDQHEYCDITTLWNNFDIFTIFDYSSIISQHNNSEIKKMESNIQTVLYVTRWLAICVGLPLTILAIYPLYSLVRNDHVAPIFVINLLISDLIQFCCMIVWVAQIQDRQLYNITYFIYIFGLMTSIGFMVCVALERYLVIAWPLWYRFARTISVSVVVCVVVWTFSLVAILFVSLVSDLFYPFIVLSILLLLPFPVLVFCLAGTLRSLSASISVPSEEKRRIVGVLVLVLLNYTLLFLPTIVLSYCRRDHSFLHGVSFVLIQFSPLADLVLYVFLRKGAIDELLACLCRCRMDSNENNRSSLLSRLSAMSRHMQKDT